MDYQDIQWGEARSQFPIFKSKTYINSCSYGALSIDVESAFQSYLSDRHTTGSDWYNWVDQNEALRQEFSDLFGASVDEIAVTASASAGINSIASAMDFSGKRNKVILTELEFPTNSQIWFAQKKHGANVVRVCASKEKSLLERLEEEIDEETLIVAITHVCYKNGEKLPIAAIRDLARKNGAYIMIDGYQAIGTMDINLTKLDVDFYVGGTLKYLLGTAGVAFLYANQKTQLDFAPSVTGWFAQENIHAMDDTQFNPSLSARRFEAGTPPIPNIYACRAGLAIIKSIGLANIEKKFSFLTHEIISQVQNAGYVLASPNDPIRHGAMIAIKSTDEHGLVRTLDDQNIIASSRDGNLRLSPHFYNNISDIENGFNALSSTNYMLYR